MLALTCIHFCRTRTDGALTCGIGGLEVLVDFAFDLADRHEVSREVLTQYRIAMLVARLLGTGLVRRGVCEMENLIFPLHAVQKSQPDHRPNCIRIVIDNLAVRLLDDPSLVYLLTYLLITYLLN